MSKEITNIVTDKTTKEDFREAYKNYPDVHPKGFEGFHEARVMPIFYEIPDGSKVLDVGCNSGEFIKLLQDKKKCEVTGVDVSDEVLNIARKKGLYVINNDAEALSFPDNSFDVVVLMEVLVHLHNPGKALKEIKRVLKPGGMLLGSVPHENLERYVWDDKRLHHRYYNETTLNNQLLSVFDNIYFRVLKGGQFAVSMAQSHLAKKPCEMLFKCGGKKSKDWEEALLDKSILRAYYGFTQLPGTVYYRMQGYADKIAEMEKTEIAYEPYEETQHESPGAWQNRIKLGPGGKVLKGQIVLDQLDAIVKCSDLSAWQIVGSRDVLTVLATIKYGLKRKIITDVDDWVFDIPSYNAASGSYRPGSDAEFIAKKQMEMSDALIVSTGYIKDNLKKLFPKKKMFLIKNSIDFDKWDKTEPWKTLKQEKKEGVIRIGYTGCANHSWDIEIIKKPILALLEEFPNVEFVLPQPFESFADVQHPRLLRSDRWVSIDAYPSMIKGWDLDIGVAPLRDNHLNRAKSNLRWLEFSALGIPTVASNIYPFQTSINHGKDGIICSSRHSWYEELKKLITDKQKRIEIGENAYKRVKKDFNMNEWAKIYKNALEEIKNESIRIIGRNRPASRRSK